MTLTPPSACARSCSSVNDGGGGGGSIRFFFFTEIAPRRWRTARDRLVCLGFCGRRRRRRLTDGEPSDCVRVKNRDDRLNTILRRCFLFFLYDIRLRWNVLIIAVENCFIYVYRTYVRTHTHTHTRTHSYTHTQIPQQNENNWWVQWFSKSPRKTVKRSDDE